MVGGVTQVGSWRVQARPWVTTQLAAPAWQTSAHLQDPRLAEVSGVAVSRSRSGQMWVHNDSGDAARVFAIDAAGAVRAEVVLDGVKAFDWEDIALGRGADGRDVLYVADTGDNYRVRRSVTIHRFAEPAVEGVSRVRSEPLVVTYPGLRGKDVETLLVDPRTQDLFLVTKVREGSAEVFRVPASAARGWGGGVRAELVAELPGRFLLTGGDISVDGGTIVLRDYRAAYVWKRQDGEQVADALRREPLVIDAPDGAEAIAFGPDGRSLVSIPEGTGAPISRIDLPR